MYTDFFGLSEKPFSITPDPRYLYLTQRHADALAHLIYGINESGGFIQLTGEVGTGKTTLIRSLLEQLPEKVRIAVILNPNLNSHEFLAAICGELHILLPPAANRTTAVEALNKFLLRAHGDGTRVVLIVDEAQTLDVELLEQVRLLTNLETAKQKLLQIILIGQPELRELLLNPTMRQVAQRITGRYHLEPLSRDETAAYVRHRLKVAGAYGEIFKRRALRELHRQSGGIPRLINVVADRALLAAYTMDAGKIDSRLVRRAAAEVFGKATRRWWPFLASGTALGLAAMLSMTITEREAPRADLQLRPIALARISDRYLEAPVAIARTLAQLLSEADFSASRPRAFKDLLDIWGIESDLVLEDPCSVAQRHGLMCLSLEESSLTQLRQLSLPSILSLTDDQQHKHFVVANDIGANTIELSVDGHAIEVPVSELLARWTGEHELLWRPLTPGVALVSPGMRSGAVGALRDAIDRVEGYAPDTPVPLEADVYDADLEARVRAFQARTALAVDGIVGARTQIALAIQLELPEMPMFRGGN